MQKKHSAWQKALKLEENPGWCAPATLSMVLAYAGINLSQKEIADLIYLPWWGTTNDTSLGFLSMYFPIIGFKSDCTIIDIQQHLNLGHVMIADWMDGYGATDEDPADGHYSVIIDYDDKNKLITLADPSTEKREIWQISKDEFFSIWYDYIDARRNVKLERYMIWLDPKVVDYQPAYPSEQPEEEIVLNKDSIKVTK